MKAHFFSIFLILFCLLSNSFAYATKTNGMTIKELSEKEQAKKEMLKKTEAASAAAPHDKYNRISPRSSILALGKALKNKDYELAVNYLDLRNLPFSFDKKHNGPELARQLSIIASRAIVIDAEDLSIEPTGHKNDGLAPYLDRITTIETKKGTVDILIQRVPRGDGISIWKISNKTISKIPALNKEFGYGLIGDKLSLIFYHYSLFGIELWQLFVLAVLLIIGYSFALILTFIITKIILRKKHLKKERLKKFIIGPFKEVLQRIRALINQQKFIDKENSRVRFLEFGEYAQELELYVYIKSRDFTIYLEQIELINLEINTIVESIGVKLVIPAHTTYLNSAENAKTISPASPL